MEGAMEGFMGELKEGSMEGFTGGFTGGSMEALMKGLMGCLIERLTGSLMIFRYLLYFHQSRGKFNDLLRQIRQIPESGTQFCIDTTILKSQTKLSTTATETKNQKHTTEGIRWSSPTQLLIFRSPAYIWQSGRDAQFSGVCGRM